MKIRFKSKIFEDSDLEQNPDLKKIIKSKGVYLMVAGDKIEDTYIKQDDFRAVYEEAKTEKISPTIFYDSSIPEGVSGGGVPEESSPKFSKVINFLSDKMKVDKDNFKDNEEVVVESVDGFHLELPWETITDKNIFVIRKVIVLNIADFKTDSNNLLILMSHAHDNKVDISASLAEEACFIHNFFTKQTQSSFRIDNISLSKHTTKKEFCKLNFKSYNFLHFIMHGDEFGRLLLEKNEEYKKSDPVSICDLLKPLWYRKFTLIFLSCCFSGGGVNDECLSLQLVKRGISKYSIGYYGGVGDGAAKDFSDKFYSCLASGKEIEEVYKESLRTYYRDKKDIKNIPFLYTYCA